MKEFDSTVYFLDEDEIEFVRSALQAEYQEDLPRNVLCVMFDLFERQSAEGVRAELIELFDPLELIRHFLRVRHQEHRHVLRPAHFPQ